MTEQIVVLLAACIPYFVPSFFRHLCYEEDTNGRP